MWALLDHGENPHWEVGQVMSITSERVHIIFWSKWKELFITKQTECILQQVGAPEIKRSDSILKDNTSTRASTAAAATLFLSEAAGNVQYWSTTAFNSSEDSESNIFGEPEGTLQPAGRGAIFEGTRAQFGVGALPMWFCEGHSHVKHRLRAPWRATMAMLPGV